MSISDIFKRRKGIYDESDYTDDDEFEDYPDTDAEEELAPEMPEKVRTASADMLRMQVMRPKEFREATKVADCLKNGQAVVLNLEDMQNDSARRMIDYLAGVLYAVDGKIERPAHRTFLLTPKGVSVASEDMAQLHPER